ncbi:MSCRAMM family protein [Catalinimonas niigatensis]|uniref:MSCRAMM family protein n=1 Tax=Catalinimonas niigatensis TaxID=1397264 RepID=UPI002665CEC7|nr:carboxypeptidase-like regulatory domain-containing protein [Catalinimonas niigatensis]WPP51881.1 carboxypeptidase-like regulatory domain-containing protein [Catalinimonas niigatensis]
MKKNYLSLFLVLLIGSWGCQKDEDVETTGIVRGMVTKGNTSIALDDVKIIVFESNSNTPVQSLTTAADGTYTTELEPGSYYVRLYRNGYEQVPPRNISAVPFTISLGEELENPIEMFNSDVEQGGYILGKVSEAGKEVAGVLIVGEKDGKGYSTVSDAQGNFFLYNLPAGNFQLKAWIGGYESEQKAVNVSAATESQQNILLTQGATGTVSGTISFLASTAVEVDVALTHPLTHEPIPGLKASTTANYSIQNVPAGTFLARATYRNDERVVDPDWIVKFGEPLVEVAGGQVNRDFSLTNALKVMSPTNLPSNTIPSEITSLTPSFSWESYASASDYVVEVSDASGNVIWGGIDRSQSIPVKKVIIPSSQTRVDFNYDGTATKSLEPGKVYRWRVFVSKDDKQSTSGWRLISVSEDQLGLIKVAR